MNEPLEHLYFNWLCVKVTDSLSHSTSTKFYKLLSELHRTEFVWLLSGDDNRAEDGCDLRKEFLREAQLDADAFWLTESCSVFEMLIALSRRASFDTGDSPKNWFWIMIDNLGLANLSDASRSNRNVVAGVLDTFIWRTYNQNGDGGLFPIRNTRSDQRKVELWYQFSEYIYENDIV